MKDNWEDSAQRIIDIFFDAGATVNKAHYNLVLAEIKSAKKREYERGIFENNSNIICEEVIKANVSQAIAETVEKNEKALELLRSAYSIAQRKGIATNWEGFEAQLKNFFFPPPPAGNDKRINQTPIS